jgi:hypothetical protein
LKGDTSLEPFDRAGSRVVASLRNARPIGLPEIFGFSALFTGGGTLDMASRRNSPDLRGGGGDGGCDADSFGDFPGSR